MAEITQSKRQLAWVFDLNKCMGCQTCSVACKVLWNEGQEGTDAMWWMTCTTKPGAGSPRDWETMGGGYDSEGKLQLGRLPTAEDFGGDWAYNFDEVISGGRGQSAHLKKISGNKNWGMNWDEDEGGGEFPNAYYFYLPRLCNHCTQPSCVEACPHDVLFKREEDGLVLRDEDRCKGSECRACQKACPYKKIYFNEARNVCQHCIGCFPRVEKGVAPACVRQCPGRAAFTGFLDDESSVVYRLVKEWGIALPLHPEFGTQSNVYYVPPLAPMPLDPKGKFDPTTDRIPLSYLESLFGPGVGAVLETLRTEIARKREGQKSEIMDALILYRWKDALSHLDADPAEIVWE